MDVKEILHNKHISYKSRGKDYIVHCLNPEHDDSNPSMRIDKISGLFHCFSCGYSGDIFKYFNINKERFIDIKAKQVLEQIMNLQKHPLFMPLDSSYYKDDFRDISNKTLKEFSAFTTDSIKGMEGRLVFPIWDITSDIVAFIGRHIHSDLDPKYKIYPDNISLPLYPPTIKGHSIILVEGILDMINLYDKGIKNAVCVWGTAFGNVRKTGKRQNNVDRLLQYKYQGVDTVYIMFDGDEAGRKAANGLHNYIKEIFMTDIINLPDGKDPGNLTKKEINKIKEEYNV